MFQSELSSLEQERAEALRRAGDSALNKSKVDESYKKKLRDLEEKLREAK